MMQRLSIAALCAAVSTGALAQESAPLEATLHRGVNEPSFYVDQPAFVAVFEVIPGQGVQQLFPRSSSQAAKPVEPGSYLLSRPFRSPYGAYGWNSARPYARPMWMVDGRGRIVSYYYTTAWTGGGWGAPSFDRTRTLLLVASRTPLRMVGSPDAAQHWLQQTIGFQAISASVVAPHAMLTNIVDAIVPVGTNVDDVVVDVLDVNDTDILYNRYAGQSISFYCPSVGSVTVPTLYFFESGMFFCPVGPHVNDTPVTPTTPGAPADTVTREDLNPRARKPQPEQQGDERAVPFRRGVITVGVPVDIDGLDRGRAMPTAEAFVPYRNRREPSEDAVLHRSRVNRETGAGYGMPGSPSGAAAPASRSTGDAPSAAAQAQAERSAAMREAVREARPVPSKPDPIPPQR